MRKQTLLLTVLIICSSGFTMAQDNSQFTAPSFFARSLAALYPDWSRHYETGPQPYSPRWNVSFFFGGATTPQSATLTLKTTGGDLFGQTARTLDLDISGILIGLSLRYHLTDNLSLRVEAFDLVPYTEQSNTMTTWRTVGPAAEKFIAHFHWDGVQGEAAMGLRGGFFLIGGLRYEALSTRLTAVTPISAQTSELDEGSTILHTLNFYGGVEYSHFLPFSGKLTVRVAGFPSIYGWFGYDMTLRDPAAPLSPIQYSTSGSIHKGSYGEIYLRGTVGVGFAHLGIFTGVKAVDLRKTLSLQALEKSSGSRLEQSFDMGFSRTIVEAGAYAVIPF